MFWAAKRREQREQLACAASLAGALLALTADRPMREYFRKERCECRRILRRSVRPRYIESGTARADLVWLRDTLGEVREFSLEIGDAPEQFEQGWGSAYAWPEGSELVGAEALVAAEREFAEVAG